MATVLRDVLPRFPSGNGPHMFTGDAELGRDFTSRSTGRMKFSDLYNLNLRKLGESISLSRARAVSESALRMLVGHVVGVSAKEQMVGVHARGIVAGVENVETIRDIANEFFVGDTVSRPSLVPVTDYSVPVLVEVACPVPATVRGLVYFSEQSFSKGSPADLIGTNATTRRDGHGLHSGWGAMKGGATDGTSKGDTGRLGLHFWSLLNRFRGAMPRVASNNAGAFATLHYTRKAYGMGVL